MHQRDSLGFKRVEAVLDRAVRITKERAETLLMQCKWLLIVSIAALGTGALCSNSNGYGAYTGISAAAFAISGIAALGYLICLGRLAHGLGRSVILYVGLTILASSFMPFLAYIFVYLLIRHAAEETFRQSVRPSHLEVGTR